MNSKNTFLKLDMMGYRFFSNFFPITSLNQDSEQICNKSIWVDHAPNEKYKYNFDSAYLKQ